MYPNQIITWKKQFLKNANQVFANDKSAAELRKAESERDELYKQIGRMKVETDWLKKVELKPLEEQKQMIDGADEQVSINRQCRLVEMHCSAYYFTNLKSISKADLQIVELMNRMYGEDPTRRTRRYRRNLKLAGVHISLDKVRWLMMIMRIKMIYCMLRTTVIDPTAYKCPYLLRGLDITQSNQV